MIGILLEGYGTFYPIIPTLLISVFINWFGLAVSSLRFLPLACGFGLLAASYFIAYQFARWLACGLIAGLFGCHIPFVFYFAHLIRYDIIVALAYGSLAISIAGVRRRPD